VAKLLIKETYHDIALDGVIIEVGALAVVTKDLACSLNLGLRKISERNGDKFK
jgi:hypothetical protein